MEGFAPVAGAENREPGTDPATEGTASAPAADALLAATEGEAEAATGAAPGAEEAVELGGAGRSHPVIARASTERHGTRFDRVSVFIEWISFG
jgi:hypothetical protein